MPIKSPNPITQTLLLCILSHLPPLSAVTRTRTQRRCEADAAAKPPPYDAGAAQPPRRQRRPLPAPRRRRCRLAALKLRIAVSVSLYLYLVSVQHSADIFKILQHGNPERCSCTETSVGNNPAHRSGRCCPPCTTSWSSIGFLQAEFDGILQGFQCQDSEVQGRNSHAGHLDCLQGQHVRVCGQVALRRMVPQEGSWGRDGQWPPRPRCGVIPHASPRLRDRETEAS